VADALRKDPGVEARLEPGGFGELTVRVDDQVVFESSRLWYPAIGKVVRRVRAALASTAGGAS
jgi:hypothetical protein